MTQSMNLEQYLALVRNEEITTVSYEALPAVDQDDFARSLGATLKQHLELPIQTLELRISHVVVTTSTTTSPTDYPILDYLCRTTSLKRFDLHCDEWGRVGFDAADEDEIARSHTAIPKAIAVNQSIIELNIEGVENQNAVTLLQNIFQELAKSGSGWVPLEKVHLEVVWLEREPLQLVANSLGLANYFESLTERDAMLKQLKLSYVSMDVPLLDFLFKKYFSRMERIDLLDCYFDVESCQRFISLMRMPTGGANSGSGSKESVDVSIRYENGDDLHYEIPPSALGSFLLPSTGYIKLCEWETSISVTRHVPILAFHLPKSLYLNTLEVFLLYDELSDGDDDCHVPGDYFHNDPNLRRQQLLDGVRRNGSLHSLSIIDSTLVDDDTGISRSYFSPRDERKVDAWVTRNKKLPELLSAPQLNHGRGVLDDGVSLDGTTDLELFPSLFTAASEATAVAYTNVLIGLMAAAKDGTLSMGPTPCNGKRNGTTS